MCINISTHVNKNITAKGKLKKTQYKQQKNTLFLKLEKQREKNINTSFVRKAGKTRVIVGKLS